MGFKKWWKKLKGWQKGGVIGFLFFIFYYLLFIIATLIISYIIGNFNCGLIIEKMPCSSSDFIRVHLLIFLYWIKYGIYLAIIGGAIGLIIDVFKRK